MRDLRNVQCSSVGKTDSTGNPQTHITALEHLPKVMLSLLFRIQ